VDVVAPLVILVVLIALVALVSSPLRARERGQEERRETADRVAELEARKEAKYREIRDAEMDLRTGKLSEDDHRVLDRQLRAEAIEVLRALDEATGR
jgi:flagellar biosynthesis/type III secretory pathway M-ring protein FliF/YscJ